MPRFWRWGWNWPYRWRGLHGPWGWGWPWYYDGLTSPAYAAARQDYQISEALPAAEAIVEARQNNTNQTKTNAMASATKMTEETQKLFLIVIVPLLIVLAGLFIYFMIDLSRHQRT